MKPRGTSLKKSKKRRAIALVTLGDLWRPGSALGGYGGALGGPGGASGGSGGALEALGVSIYRLTPDQPRSGRYVNVISIIWSGIAL